LLIDPSSEEICFLISIKFLVCGVSNHRPITAETIIKPKDEGDIAVSSS
jgi:hypothetical protein